MFRIITAAIVIGAIILIAISLKKSPEDFWEQENVTSVKKGDNKRGVSHEIEVELAIPVLDTIAREQFDWNGKLSVAVGQPFWYGADTSGGTLRFKFFENPNDTATYKERRLIYCIGTVKRITRSSPKFPMH